MALLFLILALPYERFRTLLDRARRGHGAAWKALVDALLPVVRARVGRALGRATHAPGRLRPLFDQQEDVEQQVFLFLFKDDARALAEWDPARGMSLENYVGLIAQREATNAVRYWRAESRRDEVLAEGDEAPDARAVDAAAAGAEERLAQREQLERLWAQLEASLTPKGLLIFRLLFVEELDADEVAATLGLTKRSVWNWTNRLRTLVREVGADDSAPAVGGAR